MSKRPTNLLICFDAFGTLFKPKPSVEEQYATIAHRFGLGLNPDGTAQFGPQDVRASFRRAYKDSAREYPNYGRAVGMGARQWWTRVIRDTFVALIPPEQICQAEPIPPGLAPALLDRFSSSDGYQEPSPGLLTLFRQLKSLDGSAKRDDRLPFTRIITGVITNSDDRVPDILSSFGLRVSPLRFGDSVSASSRSMSAATGNSSDESTNMTTLPSLAFDIDFHCISYDVGFEKPDRRIFEAAEGVASSILSSSQTPSLPDEALIARDWLKIYVGDEYRSDVLGALGAGWNAVWVADEEIGGTAGDDGPGPVGNEEIVYLNEEWLEGVDVEHAFALGSSTITGLQPKVKVVKCSSLEVLVQWLQR